MITATNCSSPYFCVCIRLNYTKLFLMLLLCLSTLIIMFMLFMKHRTNYLCEFELIVMYIHSISCISVELFVCGFELIVFFSFYNPVFIIIIFFFLINWSVSITNNIVLNLYLIIKVHPT